MEVEAATLELTSSVSENAYKTAGVIAAAAVAGIVKPAASRLIAALGGAVIAAYLLLILCYYFPTMKQTWAVRKQRFGEHIRSFEDLLGEKETSSLLEDPRVPQAQAIFEAKFRLARNLYWLIFVLAVGAALYVLLGGPLP